MITQTLAVGFLAALAAAPPTPSLDLLALRVGKAETIAQGTIENAVILIEGKKIVAVGEDLPVERGIPVIERPDWVVTPGLVNCHSRAGLEGKGRRDFAPQLAAVDELDPQDDVFEDLLEAGVTTLGLYPVGTGIPGQAVAVRPMGETVEDMVVADSVYLKINLESNESSKKMLRDAFEEADDHEEKVAKAREKWEKEQEKEKKKSRSSRSRKKDDEDEEKDEEKDDEKEEDEDDEKNDDEKKDDTPKVFVAPEPDEKVKPFLELRAGELTAMMSIRKAGDYLHLLDIIEDEELGWFLHVPLRDDIDLYEIAERLGEDEVRVALTTRVTLQPLTRRERNLPAELSAAGAKIVLLPRGDAVSDHERWIHDVGRLVAAGMDRQAALAAVTLEAARALGLGDRLGSLEEEKDANLVLWDGDPFEPSTRIQAVILEGEVVSGELER